MVCMKNQEYPLYELPLIRNLRELVLLEAESRPEQLAFTCFGAGRQMWKKTRREVFDEMNALGTWMAMEGFCGIHIAILGENSYEWMLGFLAAVNGGNVAVPIDKELPRREVQNLMRLADVSVVFCSEKYRERVDTTDGVRVILTEEFGTYIEAGKSGMEAGITDFTDFEIEPEHTACIFFTSGTSGASKGVALSHGNLAADVNNTCKLFSPNGDTVALLPFHHAFGLMIGLMLYHYGCTVHINKSLKTVQKSLSAAKPQTLFLVPLYVETFHKQIWETARKEGKEKLLKRMMAVSDFLLSSKIDIRKKCFASVGRAFGGNLEYIICGGAALDVRYVKEFRSWGIEILNGYGTTECSPCTAVNRNFHHRDGTVGLLIPGSRVKIAEDGEILVWGPHVMQGYYKDNVATEEALKDGWYATGDLGSLSQDGFLTITGRKKNLIILPNGENISPEELEGDFRNDEGVREVLVYERDGAIIAEIYPDERHMGDENYFTDVMKQVNSGRPLYKQVAGIRLRDHAFEKNTSMKIVRYKIRNEEEKG